MNRACAFDVLENHKHIDMSAESAIIVFIANIFKKGYQEDALSEIEKLISHNSLPILVTNIGDTRFDNFSFMRRDRKGLEANFPVPVLKIPTVGSQYSFSINVLLMEMFINSLHEVSLGSEG